MEIKFKKRIKSKRSVAALLLSATMLLSIAPTVQAEDSQTQPATEATTQTSTEETVTPNVIRYEGLNREEVAVRVAQAHFSDSNKVIVVNRNKFPDAISATNISQGQYPVLYTNEGNVPDRTLNLLESMGLDEIYILGGELSVHESVVEQLEEATNVKVTRIAGENRYVANVNAVEENFTQANHVVIASGAVYADALYGVSYANTVNSPVLLTRTNGLDASTVDLLNDLNVENVTIIGGPVTVTESVENQLTELGIAYNRIAGRNRYIGSAEVARESYDNPENVVVASGEVFSDALVSAPLAQKLNAPILLVRNNRMVDEVQSYLAENRLAIENIYIQGGPLTINPENENHIKGITTYLVESGVLPFERIEEEDPSLLAGEREVTQTGEEGFQELFYNVTLNADGEEIAREEFHRETLASVPEITRVGTRVDIESISLSPEELVLEEEASYGLTATILPENATNQELVWTSSDNEVVTVDANGTVTAHQAGEATITVSDSTGELTEQLVITVNEPTIESVEDLATTITQYENYEFPASVTVLMSNNTIQEWPVNWELSELDTSALGTVEINGTLEGLDKSVTLSVTIEEYDPELTTDAYSSVTINNVSHGLSLSMLNNGEKSVQVDKIEYYEQGRLRTTSTKESLENSGIPTIINPSEPWRISTSFRLGMFLDGSYVKFYVTANDTSYEYEAHNLNRSW